LQSASELWMLNHRAPLPGLRKPFVSREQPNKPNPYQRDMPVFGATLFGQAPAGIAQASGIRD
jgi:hypothetical protein